MNLKQIAAVFVMSRYFVLLLKTICEKIKYLMVEKALVRGEPEF